MNKFKVGDRVAIYSVGLKDNRRVGVVAELLQGGLIVVRAGTDNYHVHPKQCRKLKRKRKPFTYERWLEIDSHGEIAGEYSSYSQAVFKSTFNNRIIHVREVKS